MISTPRRLPHLLAAMAVVVVSTLPTDAGAQRAAGFAGPYLTVDVGASFTDDLAVTDFVSISLNTGFRTDVAGGYAFPISDVVSFAPELEVGVMSSNLSRATVYGVGSGSVSGHFTQVPVLANAVFYWAMGPRWVGYAGPGIGVERVVLSDVDNYTLASETDFAWQIKAGVRGRLGRGYIGLGYEYVAVAPEGLRRIGSSAILASYTFKFR